MEENMTIIRKENSNANDIAPAMPMATAAAFALARDDKDGEKAAAVFRQVIEPRTSIASK
jgi:hypothetical protein